MPQIGLIENAHNDLVTDAAYDFYGLRLATCSLDQRIKVWALDERQGSWSVEDDWKAHDAAITKVSWAHPEFGNIIASSSFDRTVKVWEQTAYTDTDNAASGSSTASRWVERAVLVDAKGTVRAVEFSPHHFGLRMATISSDNHLRVYECLEQPSLQTWQLAEEVDVQSLPSRNPTGHSMPQTVTLSTPTQTSSTLDGASATLAAHALAQQQQQNQTQARPGLGNREADGGWCLSWCKDRYWGQVIAVGCGVNGIVKVIQVSHSRRPATLLVLDPSPSRVPGGDGTPRTPAQPEGDGPTPFSVTSVAWAPSCGRSYHLIATGSRDGRVRIWRVKPPSPLDEGDREDGDAEEGTWSASIVGDFDDHKSPIGRVEWNITGTVLASSGNDGRVRLWKATAGNVWRLRLLMDIISLQVVRSWPSSLFRSSSRLCPRMTHRRCLVPIYSYSTAVSSEPCGVACEPAGPCDNSEWGEWAPIALLLHCRGVMAGFDDDSDLHDALATSSPLSPGATEHPASASSLPRARSRSPSSPWRRRSTGATLSGSPCTPGSITRTVMSPPR